MRGVNPHRPASFAVALALVAACSTHGAEVHKGRDAASTGTPPVSAGAGGNDASYLATGPGQVLYVRWTATGAALAGAIDQVDASTSAAAGTSPVEESLTGVRHDDRVSLTLSEGLGTYKTITGSISGDELTLTIPNSAGILTDMVLRKATADDFNLAVAALGGRAQQQASANAQATQAAQQQQQQQAIQQQAAAALRNAGSALASDLTALHDAATALTSDDLTFKASLTEASTALARARADYATQQHDDAARPPDCGTVSSDAGTIGSDEASVESGQATVASATQTVRSHVSTLSDALATASKDAAVLAQLQQQQGATDPQAQPGDVQPYAVRVPSQTQHAGLAAARAEQTAQGLVDQAKAVSAQADALSNRCTS